MGDHDRAPGRLEPTDVEEVVAVALRAEVRAGRGQEVRVPVGKGRDRLGERFGQRVLGIRRPAARPEVGRAMRRVQRVRRRHPVELRQHQRAADVGRVHARRDRVPEAHDAADRDRPDRARRARVGHYRAGHGDRRPEDRVHRLAHGLDVRRLALVARRDVPVARSGLVAQRQRRRRGVRGDHRADLVGRVRARVDDREHGRDSGSFGAAHREQVAGGVVGHLLSPVAEPFGR